MTPLSSGVSPTLPWDDDGLQAEVEVEEEQQPAKKQKSMVDGTLTSFIRASPEPRVVCVAFEGVSGVHLSRFWSRLREFQIQNPDQDLESFKSILSGSLTYLGVRRSPVAAAAMTPLTLHMLRSAVARIASVPPHRKDAVSPKPGHRRIGRRSSASCRNANLSERRSTHYSSGTRANAALLYRVLRNYRTYLGSLQPPVPLAFCFGLTTTHRLDSASLSRASSRAH